MTPDTTSPATFGRTLLIGYDGMLGHQWLTVLKARGVQVIAPTLDELDLTKPDSVRRFVTSDVSVVVNCAAYTDVDGCESDEAAAQVINGQALTVLGEACRDAGATLIHYSTDYVFNGQGDRPYLPDDPTDPVNAYGRTKLVGEKALRASGCEHLLIRTSWLYAPWAKNFVRTMCALMAQRDVISVVDDQRGCPTSVAQLVAASIGLLRNGSRGCFHVTDGGQCTWFDFAAEIARLIQTKCRVEPCTTEQFPRPAARPAYSVLDTTSTEAVIGKLPGWQTNLRTTLVQLEAIPS